MTALIAILAIAVVAALLYLSSRRTGSGDGREIDLLQLCRGNKEQMERLVAHELRMAPSISRRVAVSNAIHAIKRDNR